MYVFFFCLHVSESAELVGQHLTLERWIQIMSSRIRGLRGAWETGESQN